ncbi:terminase family protein [Candidatus Pacearchaeota archaeon]|nr:terminase family protein [Candidatus Pacearchaeota archaeon]
MELDVQRLKDDANYFVEHILKIKLHEGQKELLKCTDKRISILCSRRWGKSTVSSAKACHIASTLPNSNILCLSRSQRQSSELFKKISSMVNGCELKHSITRQTQTEMAFSNGSIIKSLPSNEDSLRGLDASFVIFDESSWIPESLFTVVFPMLLTSKGGAILISTPGVASGTFFESCQPKSEFTNFTFTHSSAVFDDGTYLVDPEELARECERMGGENSAAYRAEFLCQFVTPEGAWFDVESLNESFNKSPVEIKFGLEGHKYVIGTDLGQVSDFTTIVVLDYTDTDDLQVVRSIKFNGLSTDAILSKLYKEVVAFNATRVLIDRAGIGLTMLEMAQAKWGSIRWEPFVFTKESKIRIMTNLSVVLDRRQLALPDDEDFRSEMINFFYKENPETGHIKMAGRGAHDDWVCGLALAVEATGLFKPQGELSIGLSGNRMLNSKHHRNTKKPISKNNILM